MSKKLTVMKTGGSSFRRTILKDGVPVKDKAGNPHVLTFQPGQPVEVTAEELESIADDIGSVLSIAKPVEGKPLHKPDGNATAAFVKERDEKKAKAAEAAAAESAAAKKPAPAAPTPHAPPKDHEHKAK